MATLLHIAAIRNRLLSIPGIFATVGEGGIYPSHIADIEDPVYPNITIQQRDGTSAAWCPGMVDPGHIMIQFNTQDSLEQAHTLYGLAHDALHMQKTRVSNSEVCIHEIREDWFNSGIFDQVERAWMVSARYIVRASVP